MAFGPAKLDGDVLAVDVAGLFQTNPKARNIVRKWLRRGAVEEPNYRQSALLRTRRERPRYGGAADKCECDEFPSPHGFAPRRGLHRVQREYHILDRESCRSSTRAGQASCPLWVISGHSCAVRRCLLYPQKRTLPQRKQMSALCQKQT